MKNFLQQGPARLSHLLDALANSDVEMRVKWTDAKMIVESACGPARDERRENSSAYTTVVSFLSTLPVSSAPALTGSAKL